MSTIDYRKLRSLTALSMILNSRIGQGFLSVRVRGHDGREYVSEVRKLVIVR